MAVSEADVTYHLLTRTVKSTLYEHTVLVLVALI